ncbi:hypothetical protein BGZ46_009518 [Entomortierella lignicola]|nr:hypothetical protein BGZ46_009518 [Entomortierella lignicola]
MLVTNSLLLLAILAGSGWQHGPQALVQAYQDSEHYFLPANIYDNLPSGVQTPIAAPTLPPSSPVARASDSRSSASGPDSSPSIEITTPLLNSIYTPGSELVMTWTNNDITFPENWTPQQSILDMVTNDLNFSNSPLLTKEDMTSLAKIKLVDLRHAQLSTILKDSPISLHSLRLVSWPLQSQSSATNNNITESQQQQQQQAPYHISPSMLNHPGFTIQNISHFTMTSEGGQLTWMIPTDWEYEGEFEIKTSSLSGSGSSTNGDSVVSEVSTQAGSKSHSFWILRDAETRTRSPQYNLPSMDQQQRALLPGWRGGDSQRQRDLGVFLGIAAMMLAFVLIGLGIIVGIYRRRWAAQASSSTLSSPSESEPLTADANSLSYSPSSSSSTRSARLLARDLCQEQHVDPFVISNGDEDAHSPIDLNLSDTTLAGIEAEKISEKAMTGKGYISVDCSFVDLPLYEAQDSSANSSTNKELNEKKHH